VMPRGVVSDARAYILINGTAGSGIGDAKRGGFRGMGLYIGQSLGHWDSWVRNVVGDAKRGGRRGKGLFFYQSLGH
jgi:hypothetical protein